MHHPITICLDGKNGGLLAAVQVGRRKSPVALHRAASGGAPPFADLLKQALEATEAWPRGHQGGVAVGLRRNGCESCAAGP
jgi:hypothetical protein